MDSSVHSTYNDAAPREPTHGLKAGPSEAMLFQRLRESQQMLRLIMEHIPQLVFWKDQRSVYLGCNRRFAQAAGADSAAEIAGKRDEDLPWHERAEAYRAYEQQILSGAPEVFVEETQPRPDGSLIAVRFRLLPLADDSGRTVGVLGIGEEQPIAQAAAPTADRATTVARLIQGVALATSATMDLPSVMQSCLDQICLHLSWPIGHVYLRTRTVTGELSSAGIWHLDQPERFEALRKLTDETPLTPGIGLPGRVLQSGKPEWLSTVRIDPNVPRSQLAHDLGIQTGFAFPVVVGSEIAAILEFFSDQVIEEDETLIQIMIQISALLGRVVERSLADARLRASEKRFQDILDNCPASVYVKDLDGKYLFVNSRFEQWFSLDRQSVLGKTDFDLFPLHIAEDWRRNDLRVIRQNRAEEAEEDAPQPDGTHTYLSIKFPLLDAHGEPYATCGITTDITERKLHEVEQQRLQDEIILLQASTLKELSTPLIPISEQVMVMPLIGAIDTARARQMLDAVLHGIENSRVEVVIVDITGVNLVDTQVAATLIQASQAVRLLGARMVLTGIRPEVAQTLVGLGVKLTDVVTHSTLQSGIAFAMQRTSR
ncbi:MAG TPA: PAS domain-containing protein [Herpetosiphonaceae bacterium]